MVKSPFCVFSAFLVLGLVGSALGQTDRNPDSKEKNLAGWWKLDSAAGTTAVDSSAHGRKGTLVDGLSFDSRSVPGRIGKALKFDGKQDSIKITKYKGVTGTAPRTVAAWIKTSQAKGSIIRWGSDDAGKIFRFGFIRGRVGLDPSGGYLYVNDDLTDDKWHHVAVVIVKGDPPNLYDHVTLYVDGRLAEIHDIGLLDLWPLDTGDEMDVVIGRGFNGQIDEVRIYDRALSVEEIKALFEVK